MVTSPSGTDELFELSDAKPLFRQFGIVEAKVQQSLTIILEPQLYDAQAAPWGVHPDQSRNRLIFTGNGERGVSAPMSEWGAEFASQMPDEVLEAIRAARGTAHGTIDDEEYRKRLQDRFGSRWTMQRRVAVSKSPDSLTGAITAERQSVDQIGGLPGSPNSTLAKRRKRKAVETLRFLTEPGGGQDSVDREVRVDVPKFRYRPKEDFELEWHFASWAPVDPEGPTVYLNSDAPMLLDAVKYHQDQYPDVYAEEIQEAVRQVYGEVSVAKIAHSQKLAGKLSQQELDADYRNEKALTIALMGLLAEDAIISQRLGKFGRKKAA